MISFIKKPTFGLKEPSQKKFYKKGQNENLMLPIHEYLKTEVHMKMRPISDMIP